MSLTFEVVCQYKELNPFEEMFLRLKQRVYLVKHCHIFHMEDTAYFPLVCWDTLH